MRRRRRDLGGPPGGGGGAPWIVIGVFAALALLVFAVPAMSDPGPPPKRPERIARVDLGGDTSADRIAQSAYNTAAANVEREEREKYEDRLAAYEERRLTPGKMISAMLSPKVLLPLTVVVLVIQVAVLRQDVDRVAQKSRT